jgi:hypothetical protein
MPIRSLMSRVRLCLPSLLLALAAPVSAIAGAGLTSGGIDTTVGEAGPNTPSAGVQAQSAGFVQQNQQASSAMAASAPGTVSGGAAADPAKPPANATAEGPSATPPAAGRPPPPPPPPPPTPATQLRVGDQTRQWWHDGPDRAGRHADSAPRTQTGTTATSCRQAPGRHGTSTHGDTSTLGRTGPSRPHARARAERAGPASRPPTGRRRTRCGAGRLRALSRPLPRGSAARFRRGDLPTDAPQRRHTLSVNDALVVSV